MACIVINTALAIKNKKSVEKAHAAGQQEGWENGHRDALRNIVLVPMSQFSVAGKNVFSATAQVTYWDGKLYEAKLENFKREE